MLDQQVQVQQPLPGKNSHFQGQQGCNQHLCVQGNTASPAGNLCLHVVAVDDVIAQRTQQAQVEFWGHRPDDLQPHTQAACM
jgi:hypothetical protein